MLIPRFTIRRLLVFMAACGAFCWVVAAAFRGQTWAIGVSAGVAGLGLIMLLHSVTYLAAWWISLALEPLVRRSRPRSPFVDGSLPPQLVPPQEPE